MDAAEFVGACLDTVRVRGKVERFVASLSVDDGPAPGVMGPADPPVLVEAMMPSMLRPRYRCLWAIERGDWAASASPDAARPAPGLTLRRRRGTPPPMGPANAP